MKTKLFLTCALILIVTVSGLTFAGDDKQGVYEYVILSAEGEFDAISDSLETAALSKGWEVLTVHESGVPEGCEFRAAVLVLYDSEYGEQIMQANSETGPFAVVDRISLFQDKNGTHVAIVNPNSINRTVLMEDDTNHDWTETHRLKLRDLITASVQGEVSEKQYGQFRNRGYIGRTMGVMAGGSFDGKIKEKLILNNEGFSEIVQKVKLALSQTGPNKGMTLVYTLELEDHNTVVFGTTGTPMDSRSYEIVKAGSDKSRKKFAYPGLAYVGAYPIEVVVSKVDNVITVRLVGIMYRMKMYFEDAGKMAFMKNMGMPGDIEGELEKQIKSAFSE
ncbi:hypothetical protein HQ585_20645 [candidate division KSB1 bacterium]|nr:hypothetical protein [candidate division KSB1 bacterium]